MTHKIQVKLPNLVTTSNTGASIVNSEHVQKQFVQVKLPNVWISVTEKV